MRDVTMKISAMLMVIWYSMSIIGFNVHTCVESGESFVVTVLEGTDCENIHPEHKCCAEAIRHCCGCCHRADAHGHDDTASVGEQNCCQDDIQVLLLTGDRSDDDSRHHYYMDLMYPSVVFAACFSDAASNLFNSLDFISDSGLIVPEDVQSVLGIWRI